MGDEELLLDKTLKDLLSKYAVPYGKMYGLKTELLKLFKVSEEQNTSLMSALTQMGSIKLTVEVRCQTLKQEVKSLEDQNQRLREELTTATVKNTNLEVAYGAMSAAVRLLQEQKPTTETKSKSSPATISDDGDDSLPF